MCHLAVVILTHNEELHVARAIQAVSGIAQQVFIIDSGSTDNTRTIAQANGAIVLQNKFVNYARQFQWALANAPIKTTWVMRLDADEIVEPDLAAEIQAKLPFLSPEVAGVNLKRKHIFMNRWICHGDRYPLTLLRIWRHGQGRIEDRWMDEHMIVWGGHTITFDGGFSDHNLNNIGFFIEKHNKYATREAIDILVKRYSLVSCDNVLSKNSSSRQAAIKRVLKERFYNRLPFWAAAFSYFLYRYFFRLGFMDGLEGLIYHFLQGFWYRFLVGVKTFEFEAAINTVSGIQEKRSLLSRITSHDLSSY